MSGFSSDHDHFTAFFITHRHRFLHIHRLACTHGLYRIFFMHIRRCSDIYRIYIRIRNYILNIGIIFLNMMPESKILDLYSIPPHYSVQLRMLYFIKCRSTFLFTDISTTYNPPTNRIHIHTVHYFSGANIGSQAGKRTGV